jgi:hypothetical protein
VPPLLLLGGVPRAPARKSAELHYSATEPGSVRYLSSKNFNQSSRTREKVCQLIDFRNEHYRWNHLTGTRREESWCGCRVYQVRDDEACFVRNAATVPQHPVAILQPRALHGDPESLTSFDRQASAMASLPAFTR